MKKILKINNFTYFFIISAILTGLFKECLILLFIIIMHELGHVMMIKHYNYALKEIAILPFGGVSKINKDLNSSINEEIIISLAGIFMQLILFVIISFLTFHNYIDKDIYNIFKKYNFSILIFNLLPIIPLDGSIFIKSLLEKYFSFYLAQKIIIIISFIFLSIFIYFNYYFSLNNYLIAIFLFYKIYNYIKELKYLKNRFLLERYLHNYNFNNIKVINKINKMQKEKKHYFKVNNNLVNEKTVLKQYFNS